MTRKRICPDLGLGQPVKRFEDTFSVIVLVLATITPAFAQQPSEYNLKLSPAEVDIISEGLQTQPFGKVYPLINKLREQIIAQQPKPVDPPKPAVTNDPAK